MVLKKLLLVPIVILMGITNAQSQTVVVEKRVTIADDMAACHQKNNGSACESIGFRYLKGLGFLQSDGDALMYFEKACEFSNARGCMEAAQMYQSGGDHISQDLEKSLEFFSKSCELDNEQEECAEGN